MVRVHCLAYCFPCPLLRTGLGLHQGDAGVLGRRVEVVPAPSLPGCGGILAGRGHGRGNFTPDKVLRGAVEMTERAGVL